MDVKLLLLFEKMTKNLNHVLFWGPKWPQNWDSRDDIQHISTSTSNWHVNQFWCESSEKMRKWQKTGIFIRGPSIGPLRPIFHTPLKVLGMSMWGNTDVKHVKTFFEKMTKELNFYLFGVPKLPQNWASVAHIPHTSESNCNTDVKPGKTIWEIEQSSEFILTLWSKMAQKLGFWRTYFTHLWE